MRDFKLQTYRELGYSEFDQLIHEQFEKPDYEVVAEEEWNNDSDHAVSVQLDSYTDYDKRDVQKWLEGDDRAPSWGTLLCELARRGVVPEGNYLLTVTW